MMQTLKIRAGRRAYEFIRHDAGLDPNRIRLMVGASGGPKWLALARLDRVILSRWLEGRHEPLDLLASSIGTWRFCCYAQDNPLAAFDRFEKAYLVYHYYEGQTAEDITRDSFEIFEQILGPEGASGLFSGPMRLSIMTVRGRHLLNSERRLPLGLGLGGAALGNLLHRRGLGLFFERALFTDPRSSGGYASWDDFPIQRLSLTEENLRPAVMASCAIPMVLNGMKDISGARPGIYRDGGIIDYHFDVPFLQTDPEGIVLYPHFIDHIVPGWFDKPLKWRRAKANTYANMVLISPSKEFTARLPHGKIPDRKDFLRFPREERVRYWETVLSATDHMAEELNDLIDTGRFAERVELIGGTDL